LNNETLPATIASELWTLMTARKAMIIIGSPSSGKTTLLNSLLFLLPQTTHVISVEDPPELRLYHEQWEQLTPSVGLESAAARPVTYDDILTFVLQSRPEYVVLGEIHREEVELFTQLLNVPFLCSATFHAETPENMAERLTQKPMNMPPSLLEHVDVVVKMGMRFKGKILRRIEGVYYRKKGRWKPRWEWTWRGNDWKVVNTDFPPLYDALEQLELETGELKEREKFLAACPTRLDPRQDFDRIQSYFRRKAITPD
jgi:flagellar protein FlaI